MKQDVQLIKKTYLHGMRVRLLKMKAYNAPPIGSEGVVQGVDDIGSVIVLWDTGRRLNVLLDEDEIEIIN